MQLITPFNNHISNFVKTALSSVEYITFIETTKSKKQRHNNLFIVS